MEQDRDGVGYISVGDAGVTLSRSPSLSMMLSSVKSLLFGATVRCSSHRWSAHKA